MTKHAYVEMLQIWVTKEMRLFLDRLVVPCDCDWAECKNWRLSTMIRAELPPAALAKKKEIRGEG